MLTNVNGHHFLSNKAYTMGRTLVQVILPAAASLYFGLAAIWGLPAADKVVGTLAVLATFLGVCLGISSRQYDASGATYDGSLVVTTSEEGSKLFSLEVDGDPEEAIATKDSLKFKVDKPYGYTPPLEEEQA